MLANAMEYLPISARARSATMRERLPGLEAGLRQLCEALQAQAEPRSVLISLEVRKEVRELAATQNTTLAPVVNELTTNAFKHAFEEGRSGRIRVADGSENVAT